MFGGRRRTLSLLSIPYLLALILTGGFLWAQDASTGALRGTVLDAQGAAITAADIVAIRVDTGIRYHGATNAEGRFKLDLLPPGEYSTRAEAEGMLPQNSPVVRVEVGAATELSFKLAVAGAKESLTVSGAPPLVETQAGDWGFAPSGATLYRPVSAGPGGDDGSSRAYFEFKWRSGFWGYSRVPVKLSGGRRRQQ